MTVKADIKNSQKVKLRWTLQSGQVVQCPITLSWFRVEARTPLFHAFSPRQVCTERRKEVENGDGHQWYVIRLACRRSEHHSPTESCDCKNTKRFRQRSNIDCINVADEHSYILKHEHAMVLRARLAYCLDNKPNTIVMFRFYVWAYSLLNLEFTDEITYFHCSEPTNWFAGENRETWDRRSRFWSTTTPRWLRDSLTSEFRL